MKPASPTIPLGKLGWLVLLVVIAAPTAFFFLATPKEPEEAPAPAAIKPPPSKLAAVGLRENRDWDGLPEMFAIWADKAHWENNRTRFAYWNPGTNGFSYYFEARRAGTSYRFIEIEEPDQDGFAWDPYAKEEDSVRLYLSKESDYITRPFVKTDKGVHVRNAPQVVIDVRPADIPMEPKKP